MVQETTSPRSPLPAVPADAARPGRHGPVSQSLVRTPLALLRRPWHPLQPGWPPGAIRIDVFAACRAVITISWWSGTRTETETRSMSGCLDHHVVVVKGQARPVVARPTLPLSPGATYTRRQLVVGHGPAGPAGGPHAPAVMGIGAMIPTRILSAAMGTLRDRMPGRCSAIVCRNLITASALTTVAWRGNRRCIRNVCPSASRSAQPSSTDTRRSSASAAIAYRRQHAPARRVPPRTRVSMSCARSSLLEIWAEARIDAVLATTGSWGRLHSHGQDLLS